MTTTVLAGIDPGATGAVAFLSLDGDLIGIVDMPTVQRKVGKTQRTRIAVQLLADLLRAYDVQHVYFEELHAMPGNGSLGNFQLGFSSGSIEGVVATLGLPMTGVHAATWKRALRLSKDKGTSRARAMQLWPDRAGLFKRVKDDGRAEAVLIAHWALLQMRRPAP